MSQPNHPFSAEFVEFLVEAKQHGYGSPDADVSETPGGGRQIVYQSGDWRYTDNFIGGLPFVGSETVSVRTNLNGNAEKDYTPVWGMSYVGKALDNGIKDDELGDILGKILADPDPELPVRGPKVWQEDRLRYGYAADGGLDGFTLKEHLMKEGRIVYIATFIGSIANTDNFNGEVTARLLASVDNSVAV